MCIRAYVSNYVLSASNRMMKYVKIYTHRCKTDESRNAMETSNTVPYVYYLDDEKIALYLNRNSHALNHPSFQIDSGH